MDGKQLIDSLVKSSKRQNIKFDKPDRVISKIYRVGDRELEPVSLLNAYRIYSEYCDSLDVEFDMDQELEIIAGILLGIDYTVYMNAELSYRLMKNIKTLLVLGVDLKRTFGKEVMQPEDALYILDILLRVKKGEKLYE